MAGAGIVRPHVYVDPATPDPVHRVGPYRVDLGARVIDGPAGRLPLRPLEARFLAYLFTRRGRVVYSRELLTEVWGYHPSVASKAPALLVSRLRARLGDPAELVRTVPGGGYSVEPPGEPLVLQATRLAERAGREGEALARLGALQPELEAALAKDPGALSVYADWLEENGDPYAAALKPELLKARGPAGRWFLEGLDRSGQLEFVLRDALVREVKLVSVEPRALNQTLHRLVHLRACVALEKVQIEPRPLGGPSAHIGTWSMWRELRWPASMRSLVLPNTTEEAREAVEKAARVKVVAR